jgi:hypothetical protein
VHTKDTLNSLGSAAWSDNTPQYAQKSQALGTLREPLSGVASTGSASAALDAMGTNVSEGVERASSAQFVSLDGGTGTLEAYAAGACALPLAALEHCYFIQIHIPGLSMSVRMADM